MLVGDFVKSLQIIKSEVQKIYIYSKKLPMSLRINTFRNPGGSFSIK